MDEIFFSMKKQAHLVTLYKGSDTSKLPTKVTDSKIGAVVLIDRKEVIGMQLFRTSVDATDISVFLREVSEVVHKKYHNRQICIIIDNYSAHSLPNLYQIKKESENRLRFLKSAKYFW